MPNILEKSYKTYLSHAESQQVNLHTYEAMIDKEVVAKEPDFRGVDIETATEALDVFWERNKNRIANNLMRLSRCNSHIGNIQKHLNPDSNLLTCFRHENTAGLRSPLSHGEAR